MLPLKYLETEIIFTIPLPSMVTIINPSIMNYFGVS
jgi:hypothetical protein